MIQDVLVDKASVGAVASYTFRDVHSDHTIRAVFASASQEGEGNHQEYFHGFRDGTFRPYEAITRAEAAAVLNRILGRGADRDYVDSHADGLCRFPDVPADYWAYYDIMESANAHVFRSAPEEVWLRLWDGRASA